MLRALLLTIGLSLALVACSSGSSPSATTTPSPIAVSPAVSSTPTPVVTTDGVPVQTLNFGEPMDFPADLVLFVTTGCTGCDGPDKSIVRVYLGRDFLIHTDTLFTLEMVGLTDPRSYISSIATSPGASEIVVSVCLTGLCYALGHGEPGQQSAIYRSLDGGISWRQEALLEGDYRAASTGPTGPILLNIPPGDHQAWLELQFVAFPSMQLVRQPEPGATILGYAGTVLVWRSLDGQRLLNYKGYATVGAPNNLDTFLHTILAEPDVVSNPRTAISWWVTGGSANYLAVSGGESASRYFLTPSSAAIAGWFRNGLIGNFWLPRTPATPGQADFRPAFIDFDSGIIRPFAKPFSEAPLAGERNRIIAGMRANALRVANTGSCLNIRAYPSPDAPVIYCARDGVLLVSSGLPIQDGWVHVSVPYLPGVGYSGGFARAEYLE